MGILLAAPPEKEIHSSEKLSSNERLWERKNFFRTNQKGYLPPFFLGGLLDYKPY